MGLFDSLGNILKQYAGGSASGQVPSDVQEHFDQVAQAVPQSTVADGLSAAFRSNQTPVFGEMIGSLFSNSTGEQKAALLNQLAGAAGPKVLSRIPGGSALASLLSSGDRQLTPEQAQQISPEAVQQLAAHAEKADPSIVDKASSFYAQHPTLVKTMGGAALSVVMARIAEGQSRAA
jgi:hypothetical protein